MENDIEETDLDLLWPNLQIDTQTNTRLVLGIAEIRSYLAAPANTRFWNSRLQRKGIKHKYVFLHDVAVYTKSGRIVWVLLNPVKQGVRSGKILIDSVIIATSVSKHQIISQDESRLCYLYIQDWIQHSNPESVTKIFRPFSPLEGYLPENCLLANPTGQQLCTWTLAAAIKPPSIHLQRHDSLRSIPGHILRLYNPSVHNLKKLESSWNTLATPMPLCVRVIVKSKDRLIIRQEDGRKPIIMLTTLLVADSTGMCKVTVWDDAVLSFNNISEGDQILLAGRYKVGHYNDRYLLEPKVRLVPRVSIELKLNTSDLTDVFVLDHAVSLGLSPPVWKFESVSSLVDNKVPSGRIIDLMGVVTYHGRWEREACIEPNTNTLTGQFWIRVWLKIVDHTSLRLQESQQGSNEENFVWVKMYVDLEKFSSAEGVVPGLPVVITNLICMSERDDFSHLEFSTETQIYPGDQAFSSRFHQALITPQEDDNILKDVLTQNSQLIEEFRSSWNDHQEDWRQVYEVSSLGGNSLPHRQIRTTFSLNYKLELLDFFQGLPYLTGARVVTTGKPLQIKLFNIDSSANIRETETELLNEPSTDQNRFEGSNFLSDHPSLQNMEHRSNNYEANIQAMKKYCFLNNIVGEVDAETQKVPGQTMLVLIESKDYRIWVESSYLQLRSQLTQIKDEGNTKFCIDFFRFKAHENGDFSCGVVATLRKVYLPLANQEEREDEANTSNFSTTQNNTMDFIRAFN
eukprot:TRINITY_DN6682_c0_g1_i10.p1 TRINITY_DN6682_c0_g1~~TRINITY_DN6682_c0_g1_i10.p1  ORF type:complete len:742 (-),score=92.40 TRINITY_DN6682_c0_g1_i10:456-2681(-)